jgi:hypothetical protein
MDICNPQKVGQPAPTVAEFFRSILAAPGTVGGALAAALLRQLGLKRWRLVK